MLDTNNQSAGSSKRRRNGISSAASQAIVTDIGKKLRPVFPPVTNEFLQSMKDLWLRRRAGHAISDVFTGHGLELWEEFTQSAGSTYYPFTSEARLIQSNKAYFNQLARKMRANWMEKNFVQSDQHVPLTILERGTGSKKSMLEKSFHIIEATEADGYYGADLSQESLLMAMDMVRERFPQIAKGILHGDFNKMSFNIPRRGPMMIIEFGSTRGNAEGFPHDPLPINLLNSDIDHCVDQMQEGDVLAVGMDHNQHKKSLDAAYTHELIEKFSMALLPRMERELVNHVADFNPRHFKYIKRWQSDNHLYWHGYQAVTEGKFTIDREPVIYKAGDMWDYCNCWKYTKESTIFAFRRKQNLKRLNTLVDPQERIHIHVYQKLAA